jgi:hypothetical protein
MRKRITELLADAADVIEAADLEDTDHLVAQLRAEIALFEAKAHLRQVLTSPTTVPVTVKPAKKPARKVKPTKVQKAIATIAAETGKPTPLGSADPPGELAAECGARTNLEYTLRSVLPASHTLPSAASRI